MKVIKAYDLYENAENDQITLLAEDISCKVITPNYSVPRGTYRPKYELMVDEERFDEARSIIEEVVVDGYEPIIRCTRCRSGNKVEYWEAGLYRAYIFILIILLIISSFNRIRHGKLYVCKDCGKKYRYKLWK